MKAIEILKWIVGECISGEDLIIIDIPEEGDNEWEQNEEWWNHLVGGCPPHAIKAGRYICFYQSSGLESSIQDEHGFLIDADAEIEIPDENGFDYFYLYRLED